MARNFDQILNQVFEEDTLDGIVVSGTGEAPQAFLTGDQILNKVLRILPDGKGALGISVSGHGDDALPGLTLTDGDGLIFSDSGGTILA